MPQIIFLKRDGVWVLVTKMLLQIFVRDSLIERSEWIVSEGLQSCASLIAVSKLLNLV